MKKLIIYTVIAASCAYYGILPFVVAQAGGAPVAEAPTATTTVLYMRITAYASVPEETSDHPFIMADGRHVYDGAVASNILPFGTKIKIPALFGGKVFTVEDRTSPRFRNTVDIWMSSVGKAVYFGVAHTEIVVLGKTAIGELADAARTVNSR